MELRRASQADLEELVEFYGIVSDAMIGTPFDCLWRRGYHPDRQMIEDAVSAGTLTIADDAGTIAAAVIVNREFDESTAPDMPWIVECEPEEMAIIHVLAAASAYRGSGVARTLLLHVIDKARADNLQTLRLGVVLSNTPAVKLYESCGFIRIIEKRMLFGDTKVDGAAFELPL